MNQYVPYDYLAYNYTRAFKQSALEQFDVPPPGVSRKEIEKIVAELMEIEKGLRS